MEAFYIALAAGVIGLIFAGILVVHILRQPEGDESIKEIGQAIREGSIAFLVQEYRVLVIFVILIAVVICLLIDYDIANKISGEPNRPWTAMSYLIGAFSSALAGFIGMSVAIRANTRTAAGAIQGLNTALRVAFNSGTVMGISVVCIGLIGITILWWIFHDPNIIAGFGFGASSIALFARVGGGIYTKAADVGADLVGKVEAGIPEDDPRNPATIADNVGDNVGDVAGMGADLFESYVGSIIAAIALAATATIFASGGNETYAPKFVLPIIIAAIGIIASILGTFVVRTGETATMGRLLWALRGGVFTSGALVLIGTAIAVNTLGLPFSLFWVVVIGLVAGIVIGFSTEYFTSYEYPPTRNIAKQALTGPATVIIGGFGWGMLSTIIPIIAIALAILGSHEIAGLYGVAIAAVGMLSTLGITLATDAYGPVADNAGGIAEQSHQKPEVRELTDALDSLGNTTAATGKGFAIGSAVLTALALMAAYAVVVDIKVFNILKVEVLVGLMIGSLLPFVFSALTIQAVGRAAFAIVNEVRRQFKEIPGIMEGTSRPDYAKCVSISTNGALKEMVIPGLLAIIAPILVGFALGPEALGGMLIGSITTGALLAITMANAGGAWDNAKKYIEGGELGGKGSDPHKASVVGDTVGDPFKDTAGPSLNILIKLMSIVALVFAPIFL